MNNAGSSRMVMVDTPTMNEKTDELPNKMKKSIEKVLKKKSQNTTMQTALLQYWKERDAERRAQILALTLNSNQEQEPDDDGIKSFSSHVGTMLRKLTPALRIEAKTKVFNLLADYELRSLSRGSDNSSPPSNSPLFDQNSQFLLTNTYSPISSISSPTSPI
ncbi:unnamed protein product [Parnassius apollo]|uniref:(apollo) hypothetical protein n=1 Tax=Parnassius apollo TaxID=110799 RepID=A0A8S3Y3B6_PARAO|nr:unnamed protein product [Parnassius apollo]